MRSVSRRFALRRADLDGAVCPATEEYAEILRDRPVTLVLEHRVHGVTPARHSVETALRQDVGWAFAGVDWPPDVRPGVLVTVSWRPARNEVVVRTAALDEPMRVDGVDYFHEYDPRVVTRESAAGTSNRGRVLDTVRRLGHVFEDGSAVFPESELTARSGLGRGSRGAFLLRNAVEQLIREGFVTRVLGSLDETGHPTYPAADGQEAAEMLFYAPLIEPTTPPGDDEDGDGADRREHWVNGFIRRLPAGAQPSERQLSLHQQAIDNEQITGPLAPGYTFVKKHHRHG